MANEKRLIDANALCEFFQERYEYLRNASERQLPGGYVEVDIEIQCGAIIAKEFLDKAKAPPTVDAVDVVRCKDCKHRIKSRWHKGYQCGNEFDGMASGVELKDDDFCSYGERREGNVE